MPVGDGVEFSHAILEESKQEADRIVDLAKREAERILDGAKTELDQIYSAESPHAATQTAKTRYRQIVAAAELETRKQELLTQERLIAEVQERVKERLFQLRNEPYYPDLLTRLIHEGMAALDGESFEIIVAPEDRELITEDLLTQLSEKTGKALMLSEQSHIGITGAIVQRTDKRVRSDNSLQSILQRRETEIRLLIARNLFEGSKKT